MKRITGVLLLFLFCISGIWAANVDTIYVHSQAMNKQIQVVVVTPEQKEVAAPVIYLLHGYGGNAKTWINMKPELKEVADRHNLIFVCPDGANSWYWDSPVNPEMRYETFVSSELVDYIDKHYPTQKVRNARAITGLSMGGHGALWLAFRHTDTFGAAGSTSGGVDIRPFPKNWDMHKQLGEKAEHSDVWDQHTVINQIDRIKNGDLAIIVDCGYADFFFDVNNRFHEKLLEKKIDHDYLVRPGAHDGDYWKNSIDYQLLFFIKYFNRNK